MKHTVLFVAIIASLSFNVLANEKKKDMQQHVTEQQKGSEILSKEMLADLEQLTGARSALKNKEDLASRDKAYLDVEKDRTKASIELAKEVFIKENVPIEYIISGEKAVKDYVLNNFVNKATAKTIEASTLWQSNASALTATEVEQAELISSQVRVNPPEDTQPPEPIPQPEMTDEEKAKIEASLGALGISVDDAGNIAENKPVEKPAEPEKKNVLVQKIDVQRITILGKTHALDATVFFNVLTGNNKRDISMPMVNMSPGSKFLVDGANFELSSMTEKEVVFTNLDTGVKFQEWIR